MSEEKKTNSLPPEESDQDVCKSEPNSFRTTPCTDVISVPATNRNDTFQIINETLLPSHPAKNDCTKVLYSENVLSAPSTTIEDSIPTIVVTIANDDFEHIVTTFSQSIDYHGLGCTQSPNEGQQVTIHSVVKETETNSETTAPELKLGLEHSQANPQNVSDVSHIEPLSADSNAVPDCVSLKLPVGTPASAKTKSGGNLRRGKWTAEEEAYVARVIQDFNSGYLDTPAGTTLRTYLSEKLKCDPMRITKKFTGDACIGKRVFHPAPRMASNAAAIDAAQSELNELESRWRRRLEMQQRESAKKVGITATTSTNRSTFDTNAFTSDNPETKLPAGLDKENPIAKTASWLDRAKTILQEPSDNNVRDEDTEELENQIQEVQRLIHEGPSIQLTSQELPQMLDLPNQSKEITDGGSSDEEPADKRLRTAEDAEALVGFLRSVRASAAQGGY